jgi:hypothetical protein
LNLLLEDVHSILNLTAWLVVGLWMWLQVFSVLNLMRINGDGNVTCRGHIGDLYWAQLPCCWWLG